MLSTRAILIAATFLVSMQSFDQEKTSVCLISARLIPRIDERGNGAAIGAKVSIREERK